MSTFLLTILLASVGIHLLYWVVIFWRLKSKNYVESCISEHSIVVCYKNESANIKVLLSPLLQQKSRELVLVDDYSSDDSSQILAQYNSKKIVLVTAKKDRLGKKNAIYEGVKRAKYSTIIMTDADCKPISNNWSQLMTDALQSADATLGYAPMHKIGGWIPTYARYETYLTAIQYLSYAQLGIPYMGVGRNMAVRKETALPLLLAMQDDKLASGDDDLLVQGIYKNGGSISTILHKDTYVYSDPPRTFMAYIRQKSRHITTSTQYSWLHKILLAVFAGTHMLTYLLIVLVAIIYPDHIGTVAALLGVKWTVQMIVNVKLMKILDEKELWFIFPLLDIATFVFYIILSPYLLLKRRNHWN